MKDTIKVYVSKCQPHLLVDDDVSYRRFLFAEQLPAMIMQQRHPNLSSVGKIVGITCSIQIESNRFDFFPQKKNEFWLETFLRCSTF